MVSSRQRLLLWLSINEWYIKKDLCEDTVMA
jgi:hypothetical protein